MDNPQLEQYRAALQAEGAKKVQDWFKEGYNQKKDILFVDYFGKVYSYDGVNCWGEMDWQKNLFIPSQSWYWERMENGNNELATDSIGVVYARPEKSYCVYDNDCKAPNAEQIYYETHQYPFIELALLAFYLKKEWVEGGWR